MRFSKFHGTGNDFVLVLDLNAEIALEPAFVAAVCDRHRGVGADGLIRIVQGDVWNSGQGEGIDCTFGSGDFFMDHFNADGTLAEMCGNGIRCLATYVVDNGLASAESLQIGTRSGVKRLTIDAEDGAVRRVTVNMGPPSLDRGAIGMSGEPALTFVDQPLEVMGRKYTATAVSMGNPHCVLFLSPGDDLASFDVPAVGSSVEARADLFPGKVNVEFVRVLDRGVIEMRVWERGVGETMACGTGACAAAVAAATSGRTGRAVRVQVPGGTLDIDWRQDDDVHMSGPAVLVFEGELSQRWAQEAGVAIPAPAAGVTR